MWIPIALGICLVSLIPLGVAFWRDESRNGLLARGFLSLLLLIWGLQIAFNIDSEPLLWIQVSAIVLGVIFAIFQLSETPIGEPN